MSAFSEGLQIRLGYPLLGLMIRMLLLVHKAAQQAHRDTTASLRQALMRDDRLQTGLEELLGHLRLQLEQVGHR